MKKNLNNKGMTIIEVLVATTILVVVMGAAVATSRSMIRNTVISSERTQAYNLVREGLEISRKLRDSTWIDESNNSWNEYFLNECVANYCYFDKQNNSYAVLPTNSNLGDIVLDNVTYTRKFKFLPMTNNADLAQSAGYGDYVANKANFDAEFVKVEVDVSWNSRNINGYTILTNWKPQV